MCVCSSAVLLLFQVAGTLMPSLLLIIASVNNSCSDAAQLLISTFKKI